MPSDAELELGAVPLDVAPLDWPPPVELPGALAELLPPAPPELVELAELGVLDPVAWPGELPQALSTMADAAIRAVAATTRVLLIDCPPRGDTAAPVEVPVDLAAGCERTCAH